ncbi:MAG: 4-hydroxy-tetrahydrodipicolinate synthase [Bacteroidales bacterium]|nr:4-hydroxy-tetrahydrodipicolinate synthase [Bacteroidales bacterium]
MKSILKGTGVALVTPFNQDFSIDFEGIARMVDRVIAQGVGYVVALGTTAETPAMSFAERKRILQTVVEAVGDRVPIVAGIGCNNPLEVIEQIHLFNLRKVSAILSVAPYYNKPQQQGLLAHYRMIAEASPLPLVLYNVPGRTGVNIAAETTLELAKTVPNIVGVKEASGNMAQIMRIMQDKPEDFAVISGDDSLTLPLLACGLDGVISVVANAYPAEMSRMVRCALSGDFAEARRLHYRLLPVMQACFKEGSPSGVKAFLAAQGNIQPYVRLPLAAVSEALRREIEQTVKAW